VGGGLLRQQTKSTVVPVKGTPPRWTYRPSYPSKSKMGERDIYISKAAKPGGMPVKEFTSNQQNSSFHGAPLEENAKFIPTCRICQNLKGRGRAHPNPYSKSQNKEQGNMISAGGVHTEKRTETRRV